MIYYNKKKLYLLLLLLPSIVSCATAYDKRGIYHRVRSGENINKIAKYYHVTVQELAEWNNIKDPKEIHEGLKLYIPKNHEPFHLKFKKLPKDIYVSKKTTKKQSTGKIEFNRSKFIWPVDGYITSKFGVRNGRRHDGIDIKAARGTSIKAAAAGRVEHVGRLRGYGKIMILGHNDNFFSVYAHNSKNLVKKGQRVAKGEIIGYVGSTGRSSGPHLHFEVREGEKARNPLFLLPAEKNRSVQYAKSEKLQGGGHSERVQTKPNKFSGRRQMMKKLREKEAKRDARR